MSREIDVLFLHASSHNFYVVFPMGFFSMADTLAKNGYTAKIVNTGIEKSIDPGFTVADVFENYNPKIVCIDLHWFVTSYVSIELAGEVKRCFDGPVLLGGYTSSFFHREILERFDFIDGVVAGEGDAALPAYLDALRTGSWDAAPNLCRRGPDGVVSGARAPAPAEILNTQNCANLDFLDNWEQYVSTAEGAGPVIFVYPRVVPNRVFYLQIGRGCPVSCSYCTAAAASSKNLMCRATPYYRPVDKVVEDFASLAERGVDHVCIEFYPYKPDDDYFLELFSRIRKEKIDVGVNFGCWSVPSKRFIEAFGKTFNLPKTCISISPESGSEKVRKINKGAFFSNEELYRTISLFRENNLYASVHFGLGFPGETAGDFNETISLFNRLKGTGCYLSIRHMPIEPGSPMYLDPEKFKITRYRNSFTDYYEFCKSVYENRPPAHPFGYRTEHFSEDELSRLRIRAYRIFYLRPGFLRQRLGWMRLKKGSSEYVKVGLATLIGSASMLNRWER